MCKMATVELPSKSQNRIPKTCRETHLPLSHPAAATLQKNGLLVAGRSFLKPGYRIDRSGRDHHLFHVSVSGKGCLWHEAGKETLVPGSVFFAPARTRYRFEIDSPSWSTLWFHLDPAHALWKRGAGKVLHYRTHRHLLWDQLAACLIDEGLQQGSVTSTLISSSADFLLRLLLLEAGRAMGNPTARMSGLTDALFATVHADLRRKWSLDELAARSGLSARHLTRVVQDLYQVSPMGQVLKIRMAEAAKLLVYTTYSLETIGDSVGYGDGFAFATAFKRHFNISPGAYRKKNVSGPSLSPDPGIEV